MKKNKQGKKKGNNAFRPYGVLKKWTNEVHYDIQWRQNITFEAKFAV